MKFSLIVAVAVAGITNAFAYQTTDYTCVNDCTSKGYLYNVCVSKCSVGSDDESARPGGRVKTTDYTCVNDCTAKGYMYNVCVAKCSD